MSPTLTMSTPDVVLPTAKVSERAAQGWREFCAAHDVSYASLVEAIGQWLAENADTPFDELEPAPRSVLEQAREITLARRRRSNGSNSG